MMPKDSPGQIAKLQLNNMGYSGQADPQLWIQDVPVPLSQEPSVYFYYRPDSLRIAIFLC
jgi:hypothetical protein